MDNSQVSEIRPGKGTRWECGVLFFVPVHVQASLGSPLGPSREPVFFLLPAHAGEWLGEALGWAKGFRHNLDIWAGRPQTSYFTSLHFCSLFLKWRDYYSEILMRKFTFLWMPLAPKMMSDVVFLNCNFILLKKYPGTLKNEIKCNYKILYYTYMKINILNIKM